MKKAYIPFVIQKRNFVFQSLCPLIPLTLLLFTCSCSKDKPKTLPPPRVEVTKVIAKRIPIKIEAIGHFVAYNSAEIKAQVEGRLLKLHFTEGDFVKEGQLLYTIDPAPYEALLMEAEATLAESISNQLYASEKLSMYRGLVKDQYVSPLNFLEYETQKESLSAQVMKNEAAVAKAKIDLDYCFIRAPFTGITSKRYIDEGNLIVNNGDRLLTIKQIDPIFVDFSIPEKDFPRFMRYQQQSERAIEVAYPMANDIKYQGKVVLVENEIDQSTGMIPLRGQLDNCHHTFWPGQFVRVSVILDHVDDALMIPDEAINIGQKGLYAFVVGKDNIAEYRPIETGERIGNMVQVTKGLKKDETVISNGQLNVRPRHPVHIVGEQDHYKEKHG